MKHQVIWSIFVMLSAASSLSALPSETSEDRQRDTFTLYDRNRREVNWQRQRRDAARADTRDRSYRDQSDDQPSARMSAPMDQGRNPNAYPGPFANSYSNNNEYVPYRGSSMRNQSDRRYNYNSGQEQGGYEVEYIRTNPPNYSQIPAVPPIE